MIQSFDHSAASALLHVPTGMKIALLIGFGVDKETRVVAPMPADGTFAYWRDAQGVHYVPKRDLKELVAARY